MKEAEILESDSLIIIIGFERFKYLVDSCQDKEILRFALKNLTYKGRSIIGCWDRYNYIEQRLVKVEGIGQ